MKIKIRTLDGSIYEVEEEIIKAYKVPEEEVEKQLLKLKSSMRLNLKKLFNEPAERPEDCKSQN